MGGPKKAFKKLIKKGVEQKVIKKVEPKPVVKPKPVLVKSNPEPKKVDLSREAEELKLANKRKGRRSTIKTSSSGLLEEEEIKKKTLLGG